MLPRASAGSATCIRGPRPSLPGVAPPARRSHRTPDTARPSLRAAPECSPPPFLTHFLCPTPSTYIQRIGPTEFVSLRSPWMSEFTASVRSYGAADEGSVSPTNFCTIEIGKVPVSLLWRVKISAVSSVCPLSRRQSLISKCGRIRGVIIL